MRTRLKFFTQKESLPEFEEKINKFIEKIEGEGKKFKDVTFQIGPYGLSVIIIYEVIE